MSTSSELRLTNNKEKDIIKVTKSLEGRGILLKGATKKINNQKGRLLIFFLLQSGLTAAASAADRGIQKQFSDQGQHYCFPKKN